MNTINIFTGLQFLAVLQLAGIDNFYGINVSVDEKTSNEAIYNSINDLVKSGVIINDNENLRLSPEILSKTNIIKDSDYAYVLSGNTESLPDKVFYSSGGRVVSTEMKITKEDEIRFISSPAEEFIKTLDDEGYFPLREFDNILDGEYIKKEDFIIEREEFTKKFKPIFYTDVYNINNGNLEGRIAIISIAGIAYVFSLNKDDIISCVYNKQIICDEIRQLLKKRRTV